MAKLDFFFFLTCQVRTYDHVWVVWLVRCTHPSPLLAAQYINTLPVGALVTTTNNIVYNPRVSQLWVLCRCPSLYDKRTGITHLVRPVCVLWLLEYSSSLNARYCSKKSGYPNCFCFSSHYNPQFFVEEQCAFMRHHQNSFAFSNVIRPCWCLIFNAVRHWLNSKALGCCPSANGRKNWQVTVARVLVSIASLGHRKQ